MWKNFEAKREENRSRAESLDRHLEDAVLQGRSGEVALDLLREAQHAVEGLVGPLAVLVVLLLLFPGAVRLRADLDPVAGDGQVDVLLRDAGEFRTDHELGTLAELIV